MVKNNARNAAGISAAEQTKGGKKHRWGVRVAAQHGLFESDPVFAEDIGNGNSFRDTSRHGDRAPAQDDQFICLEDGIAPLIEDDELITVFLTDLSPVPADAGILAGLFQSVLLIEPRPEGRG